MAHPYPETRIATVAAFNSEGKLLLGLREDVGLFTCPGGHLEDGERPARGAVRELYEETGLVPKSLAYLGDGIVRVTEEKILRIYCFRAEIPEGQHPTGENDPDHECEVWRWVDVSLGSLPLEYDRQLYNANDVLLKLIGLQRGVVVEDVRELDQDEDQLKVILEQPGMAALPIEGGPNFVFLTLMRRFPWLEGAAEQGDVEGLVATINESGAGWVSMGEDLDAPRFRYQHEQYDPNVHDDPWPREADVEVWATTGLRKDESKQPHPFDYSQVPPSHQDNPAKPEYEYTSSKPATQAKMWADHHNEMVSKFPDQPSKRAWHQELREAHVANAKHFAKQAQKNLLLNFKLQPTSPSAEKVKPTFDPESLPHPFRYENAPPGREDMYANLSDSEKVAAWHDYHLDAMVGADKSGQHGLAEKHKAAGEIHGENLSHVTPAECEVCGGKHETDDHECSKCGGSHSEDDCEAPYCEQCNEHGHDEEAHESATSSSSDEDGESDERVGWNGGSRGPNVAKGPIGQHILHQISAHGQPEHIDASDVPKHKYSSMDRSLQRKIDDGAVHTDDLYRAYKHSPHIGASLLLKYIVHRANNLKAYDDAGKAERLDKDFMALHQFGSAGEKNGHIKVGHLHHMLQENPQLVDELMAQRDRHQNAIRQGVGLNVKKINGKDYVALTRALNTPTMSHEHALSSFADKTPSGFGVHKHHTWVPLKDIWYSYDLGSRYPKGNHGAENEYLVSHNPKAHGHRFKARAGDGKPSRFKGDGDHGPLGYFDQNGAHATGEDHHLDIKPNEQVDPMKYAPSLDASTDEHLAHWVEKHPLLTKLLNPFKEGDGRKALMHPNAGQKTWEALNRRAFEAGKEVPAEWLKHRGVPAEGALTHMAKIKARGDYGEASEAAENVLQNPNISPEQAKLVMGGATGPTKYAELANHYASNPNLSPGVADHVVHQIDTHITSGDDGDYEQRLAAEKLVGHMTPEAREHILKDIETRKFVAKKKSSNIDPATAWNLHLADLILRHSTPERHREFLQNAKIPKSMKEAPAYQTIENRTPPTDKEVSAFAKVGNSGSTALFKRLTNGQKEHVFTNGTDQAVAALMRDIETRHGNGDRTSVLSPQQQKLLLARGGENASAMANLAGLTSDTVNGLLAHTAKLPGAAQTAVKKQLAANQHLDEKTVVDALPPSAKERLPFLQHKAFAELSSAERKKVAEYKKDAPDAKAALDLLVARNRMPTPKDRKHIIRELPPGSMPRLMAKALPGFKFPGLGAGDNRRETPIHTTDRQVELSSRAMGNAALNANMIADNTKAPHQDHGYTWEHAANPVNRKLLQQAWAKRGSNNMGAANVFGPGTISYSKANSLRTGNLGAKSDVATKLHEDFHNVFKRVQDRYGMEGRKNLAQNLVADLKLRDPEAHDALRTYFRAKLGPQAAQEPFGTEEHFTHLLNYLNDPDDRERFHRYHFGLSDMSDGDVRRFNQAMKRAYKSSVKTALGADRTFVLKPGDKSKANWNQVEQQMSDK